LTNGVASIDRGFLRISAPSNASFENVWQPVSGSNWQYTANINQTLLNASRSYMGMFVSDASDNRLAIVKSYTTAPAFEVLSNSTFSASLASSDVYSVYGPGYMQFEYRTLSNSTFLIGRYSTTGYAFANVFATNISWTPSRIGYIIGTTNTAADLKHELVSDWFRRDTSYTPVSNVIAVISTTGTVTSNGTVYSFLSSGSFVVSNSSVTADILVVGGGGAGAGSYVGGGGGGGGIVYASGVTISTGSQAVTVGAGAPGALPDNQGTNGSNSVFLTYTALGGGGGGAWTGSGTSGLGGGCGGGQGYQGAAAGIGTQGGNGGLFTGNPTKGGGGGGGGGNGSGQNGGIGYLSSITGSAVYYAGGGGGGSDGFGGSGGLGGGGRGSDLNVPYTTSNSGTANTGGGGGGGPGGTNSRGGDGGSGIVIIRVTG
jgi:hypothetical protein